MGASHLTFELWKKLGLTFASWADSTFLYGVGKLGIDVYNIVLNAIGQKNLPLDWSYPVHTLYSNQGAVLWVIGPDGQRVFLPQVVVISYSEDMNESSIKVELESKDFRAPLPVSAALEFYQRDSSGNVQKLFSDAENARLVNWNADSHTLVFQDCSYFDYLQTNLALDLPLPVIGTLRKLTSVAGQIEPLLASKLANSTGINGLLFSNDGYMIIQKRRENVLVRPGEVCSGFSGTVDKIDIVHAIESGGRLEHLDVLREMVEELGIKYKEVTKRCFLGLTRELIRGGAPEMFYAVNIGLSEKEIRSRIPKDKEGHIKTVFCGPYASAMLEITDSVNLPEHFWSLVENAQVKGEGPISVPLLTNLVLWYKVACPTRVGVSVIPKNAA